MKALRTFWTTVEHMLGVAALAGLVVLMLYVMPAPVRWFAVACMLAALGLTIYVAYIEECEEKERIAAIKRMRASKDEISVRELSITLYIDGAGRLKGVDTEGGTSSAGVEA